MFKVSAHKLITPRTLT